MPKKPLQNPSPTQIKNRERSARRNALRKAKRECTGVSKIGTAKTKKEAASQKLLQEQVAILVEQGRVAMMEANTLVNQFERLAAPPMNLEWMPDNYVPTVIEIELTIEERLELNVPNTRTGAHARELAAQNKARALIGLETLDANLKEKSCLRCGGMFMTTRFIRVCCGKKEE